MPELLMLKLKELSSQGLDEINNYLSQANKDIKSFRESKKVDGLIQNIINIVGEIFKLGKEMIMSIWKRMDRFGS
ncbi:MAG: hypothetical protein HZB81_01020 [Deltaproteobacteria bacterium]|nr:hypothetical protein [Deltaproteobacteria bacterium]